MKCNFCKKDFEEKDIYESHDVPCYLFINSGNRKGKKNQANKFGRHMLCFKCHEIFEQKLNNLLKETAILFSKGYFKKENDNNTN